MSSLRRIVGNNTLLVLLNLPVLPTRVREMLARRLEVDPRAVLAPMSDAEAALHPAPGTTCDACGSALRTTDPVRVSRRGTVHDVCPAL